MAADTFAAASDVFGALAADGGGRGIGRALQQQASQQ